MQKKTKIIVAGVNFEAIKEMLLNEMDNVIVKLVEKENLYKEIADADILIPTMTQIDYGLMKNAKHLKLIHQYGVGLDGVDIEAASKLGIFVCNVPTLNTGNAESVAEWFIMNAIALSRQFPYIQKHVYMANKWGSPMGLSLMHKRAGIVGFGGLGKALAKRLRAFNMDVYAMKRKVDKKLEKEFDLKWLCDLENFHDLLKVSDYLFICLPLNEETRSLIGLRELFSLPKGAFVLNASRGGIIDYEALKNVLDSGHIGGAALDVFWREPPEANNPFFKRNNVIVTPHIAGVTDVSYKTIAMHVKENINRVLNGCEPLNCANLKS